MPHPDIAQLGLADPDPLEAAVATQAGLLRAPHHHRRDRAISLADCVLAETARSVRAPVASSDSPARHVPRDEGVDVVPLPDSNGHNWNL